MLQNRQSCNSELKAARRHDTSGMELLLASAYAVQGMGFNFPCRQTACWQNFKTL